LVGRIGRDTNIRIYVSQEVEEALVETGTNMAPVAVGVMGKVPI
jgi:hypothetical protein